MEYFLLMRVKVHARVVSNVRKCSANLKLVQLQMSGEGATEYERTIID